MLSVRFSASFLFLACFVAAGTAQTVKLSAPLVQQVAGSVEFFQVGSSGDRVVYYADQETPHEEELFGAPIDGSSSAVKLNQPLSGHRIGRGWTISADGSRVAFLNGSFTFAALNAAPTDGSSPAVPLAAFSVEDIDNFHPELSPDGQWVVYRETETSFDLSSVRTDGSQPPSVLSSGAFVSQFSITPDGTHVLFLKGAGGTQQLFSAPIDGSAAAVILNAPPVTGGGVGRFVVSPDGQMVVYRADQDTDEQIELYRVPVDGSAGPVKLNAPLVPGGDVGQPSIGDDVVITADGAHVVYVADQDTDEQFELFSAPLDGSASSVKLSGTLASNRDVTRLALTPDGRRVLFLADRDLDETFELYMARVRGGTSPVELSAPLAAGGDVLEFGIASDSEHVVYRADQEQDDVFELFSVPLGKLRRANAPLAAKLNRPLVAGGNVASFALGRTGRRVVYRADALVNDVSVNFSVPIAGGHSVVLTPPLGFGGFAGAVQPVTGEFGLYSARLDSNAGGSVYSRRLDGSDTPVELNGPLPLGQVFCSVEQFQVTPDGSQAVYLADQEFDFRLELYRVPTDGSAAPVKLNGPLVVGGSVGGGFGAPPAGSFVIGPDGVRLAYLADQDTNDVNELYGAPLDGSAPAVRLNGAFAASQSVLPGMRFGANGSRVVYRAFLDGQLKHELFSVPADGSASPVKLSGSIVTGGDVQPDFDISPGGERVVFRADNLLDERFELYSVPVDGSAPPTRLHAVLPSNRDVLSFRIDPTGERVVFVADLSTNDAFELYSVPLAGGPSPTRLNGALVTGREVTGQRISPDGTRVAYVADQLANDRYELFSAPIDGSGAAVKLSGTLVTGGDVLAAAFEFGPHGGRVVYLADQDTDEHFELYSAPSGGTATAVELSGTLVPGGDVADFQVTPGPARVIYRANANTPGTHELFLVPIDGSASPVLLSAPPAGRSVDSFALDARGFQALYETHVLGDLTRRELFRAPLDGSPAVAAITSSPTQLAEFTLAPGARRVVIRMSEPSAGALELFSARLPRVVRPYPR